MSRPRNQEEHKEQCIFFRYVREKAKTAPIYHNIFAIPNGGERMANVRFAVKIKAEGLESGVPDIFVAIPRYPYHGFFIEMKVSGRKPSINQIRWIRRLTALNYLCKICYSGQEAANALEDYLILSSAA